MPKKPKKPKEHTGVPRSFASAKKLGFKKAKLSASHLNELSASFIQLEQSGAKAGTICGVAPSPTPGHWLVCYKNDAGKCNWVDVPKPAAAHG